MPAMDELERAVQTVVNQCLGVQRDEQVVVVVDSGTRAVGEALRTAASDSGAEAVLMVMDPRTLDGEEPPAAVAAALKAAQVFIAPTTRSLSHTRARKAASDNGARGATLPGVTADMLARLMTADFDALKRRSLTLAELLTEAGEARFTCPRGSDMRFDLTDRTGVPDDGDLSAPQAFGNLPCGEGFVAPLNGHGSFVAATIAGIGMTTQLTTLTVENGHLTHATGPEGERLLATLHGAGANGTNLAELGIGTNEQATLTGNVLEDEKILGTVHVAFGASAGIGGTVSVPVHLDCVVLDPTLDIGDTRVIDCGRFLL
jgi:leucyl aminopeptidase (aminopeptidase T)